jgi:hypothetical protein
LLVILSALFFEILPAIEAIISRVSLTVLEMVFNVNFLLEDDFVQPVTRRNMFGVD